MSLEGSETFRTIPSQAEENYFWMPKRAIHILDTNMSGCMIVSVSVSFSETEYHDRLVLSVLSLHSNWNIFTTMAHLFK